MELSGKIALVTGGGRGIGRACALALSKAGARTVIAARTEDEIQSAAEEIKSAGGDALAATLDVTNPDSVQSAFARVEAEWGSVDILVNNAGAASSEPFVKCTEELWAQMIEVNMTGTFRCIKAALPGMLKRGWGRVINIASVAGKAGAPYISAYSASKHGVLGLTKALAQEVAAKGITVNAICPGYVETDMAEHAISTIIRKTGVSRDQARSFLEQQTPQKRLFQPAEVAFLTASLASPSAAGINGQAINICGGALPF